MEKKKENKIIASLKLFNRAFGVYRYRIVLLVIAGFSSGLMEGIGINTIIPLFSFVVKGQEKPNDVISRTIEHMFLFFNVPYTLKSLLILIASLFVMKALLIFCANYITDKIRTDYIKSSRGKLFDMILESNWTHLSKQKIGHLERTLMGDINVYSSLLSYMSSSVILLTNVAIYVVIAFNVSPSITIFTVALGGLFFIIFKPIMDRTRIIAHETSIVQKEVANHINESMIGIKTIKAMSLEKSIVHKGMELFERLRRIEMRLSIASSFIYVVTQPFSVLIILGVFAYSYKVVNFSFASFLVIVYAINKIFSYVQDGQSRLQNINALYPFLGNVVEAEKSAIRNKEPYQGKGPVVFNQEIAFKNVSFSYDGVNNVLTGINLLIPKGSMMGIVGPSGSGKTTLVDLLLSLIEPQKGVITVDGKSLHDISAKQWKRHIGYVSQDIFIVNDTLRNNIKFYDQTITDDEMIEAAKIAHIYDFIMEQPHGFDTQAGERGMSLSGGQRQRIALARVLARRADILVLDEATSALDNQSEAMIQKAIEELRGKVTIVIIAHRPTTVANVDKIVVINESRVVEQGSPRELLAKEDSYFYTIYHKKS